MGRTPRARTAVQIHYGFALGITPKLIIDFMERRDFEIPGLVGLDFRPESPLLLAGRSTKGPEQKKTQEEILVFDHFGSPFGA
jgi:hypothetical protein